jgi:hypothetical protein
MYGDTLSWLNGHFFVLDGYRIENCETLYHVNWGHGQSNNNTYCLLNLLREGSKSFNQHNRVIVGISPTYDDNDILSLTYTVVPQNNKRSEYAYNKVSVPEAGSSLTVDAGGYLTVEAGNEIILRPGFYARMGSEVDIHIDPTWLDHKEISLVDYSPYATIGDDYYIETKNADSWELFVFTDNDSPMIQTAGSINSSVTCIWNGYNLPEGEYVCQLVLKNSYGRRNETEYRLYVSDDGRGAKTSENGKGQDKIIDTQYYETETVELYPNPTSGVVTMTLESEVQAIIVDNAMGQPVSGWSLLTLTDQQATLDVGPLPSGQYLVAVRTKSGRVKTANLIKE